MRISSTLHGSRRSWPEARPRARRWRLPKPPRSARAGARARGRRRNPAARGRRAHCARRMRHEHTDSEMNMSDSSDSAKPVRRLEPWPPKGGKGRVGGGGKGKKGGKGRGRSRC